ncbi:MAG: hypothetical protein KA715_03470 [Xanthomonadaceae bacterium]|nr:hypothetical protein [Xanthomonadaceae bacterium]
MKNMITAIAIGFLSLQAQASDCTFAERYKELEQKHKSLVALNADLSDPARNQCSKETIYSFAEADAIQALQNDIEAEQEKLAQTLTK